MIPGYHVDGHGSGLDRRQALEAIEAVEAQFGWRVWNTGAISVLFIDADGRGVEVGFCSCGYLLHLDGQCGPCYALATMPKHRQSMGFR